MKTAKFILAILLGLLISQKTFAQGSGAARSDMSFQDKLDPVKAVQIFPNPATDVLSIRFEHPQARKIKLSVYTIIGNTVEVESEVIDDFEIRIKVRELPSGYYLLAINNQEANYKHAFKFLKR